MSFVGWVQQVTGMMRAEEKLFARVPIEVPAAIMCLKEWVAQFKNNPQPTDAELRELWLIIKESV